jgi:hypothetical protein
MLIARTYAIRHPSTGAAKREVRAGGGNVLIWAVTLASSRHWSPDESGRSAQTRTAPRRGLSDVGTDQNRTWPGSWGDSHGRATLSRNENRARSGDRYLLHTSAIVNSPRHRRLAEAASVGGPGEISIFSLMPSSSSSGSKKFGRSRQNRTICRFQPFSPSLGGNDPPPEIPYPQQHHCTTRKTDFDQIAPSQRLGPNSASLL